MTKHFRTAALAAAETLQYSFLGADEAEGILVLLNPVEGTLHTLAGCANGSLPASPEEAASLLQPAEGSLTVLTAEGTTLDADFELCISALLSQVRSARLAHKAAEERAAQAEAEVARLTAAEHTRRMAAARAAVTDELERRNRHRPENTRFSPALCTELQQRIERSEFTLCQDEAGNWTGEQLIRDAVAALCMNAQTQQDERAAATPVPHWSILGDKPGSSTGSTGYVTVGDRLTGRT